MNFESISESDPNLSKDSSKIDETEMQLIAESRGAQLEDLNDHLQKENSKLRAQFDEAIRSNSQIVELHQKIQLLSTNNNELKSKNEELNNCLSLAIRANDDLTQKYEEEKEVLQEQRKNDLFNFQNGIDKVNQKLKDTIESHQIIVSKFESDKEKMIVELKTSQNLIARLLAAAEHFFGLHFKNSEDLITLLNKPPLKVQELQDKFDISSSVTVKNQQIANIEKKRKKLIAKLEDQKKENELLKNEILSIKKDYCSQNQEYIDKIEELKNQIHEKEEDYAIIDAENKHKIETLNSQISSLKRSLQNRINMNLTSTSSSTNLVRAVPLSSSTSPAIQNLVTPIISDVKSSEKSNNKIINLEGDLEDMTHKNTDLTQKLSEAEDKISILTEKLNDIENEREEMKRNYERIKTDYNALNLLHQNSMTELQTVRLALRSREDPQIIATKKDKIKKLKERVEILEKGNKTKEIELNDQIQKYDEKLTKSENDNRLLNTENDRLRHEVTSLEEQIRNLSDDLGRKKIEQQMSFGGCGGTFYLPTSPAPQVQKVTKSIKEKDDSSNENELIKNQLKKSIQLNEQLQKEKDSFMVSLSALFSPKQPINYNDLDAIIDSISVMKKENDSLKLIVNHFADSFSLPLQYNQQSQLRVTPSYQVIDAPSLVSQINGLHTKFEKLKENLQKKSTKNCHLKKSISSMKDKSDDLEKQLQLKHDEIQKLSSNLTNLETKMLKMKRKIRSQKLQIANFERIKEESEAASSMQVDKLVCERRKIESTLRDQLCEMKSMLDEYQRQVQVLNEEGINLKKTIRSQKATIVDLKLKLENSEKAIIEKDENLKNLNSNSVENSSLNKTVTELQSQLKSSRADIEKLTKQLSCAQKKLFQMRTFCEDAKIEKEKLSKEIETLNEQIEREKQISEANAKTQILKAQSEYTQKLDEMKGMFEKEKRKYFTFAADQFSQFFNPQQTIDEKSFKDVIVRVRDELSKLNNKADC